MITPIDQTFVCIGLIVIVTITAAKETTNDNPLIFCGLSLYRFRRAAAPDEGLPRVVYLVHLRMSLLVILVKFCQ